MRVALIVCVSLGLAVSYGAVAQEAEGAQGLVESRLCGNIPANQPVEVLVLDNSDANLRIRESFAAALRRKGVVVGNGAPLTLTLDILPVREYQQGGGGGDLFELRVGQADREAGEQGDIDFRSNVWSSSRNSLVGGRTRGPSALSVNRVRVTALLNRRVGGECLWQGEAEHELGDREVEEVVGRLIAPLADTFGKAVAAHPLTLPPRPRIR